jgi:hypothetical protein
MTFAKLSTTHKNGIRPHIEGINNKQRINSSGTHDPDRPDIRRVLEARHTG